MKAKTMEYIIAGILIGLGLHHYAHAIQLEMGDDICKRDAIGFENVKTGKIVLFKKVGKEESNEKETHQKDA